MGRACSSLPLLSWSGEGAGNLDVLRLFFSLVGYHCLLLICPPLPPFSVGNAKDIYVAVALLFLPGPARFHPFTFPFFGGVFFFFFCRARRSFTNQGLEAIRRERRLSIF